MKSMWVSLFVSISVILVSLGVAMRSENIVREVWLFQLTRSFKALAIKWNHLA